MFLSEAHRLTSSLQCVCERLAFKAESGRDRRTSQPEQKQNHKSGHVSGPQGVFLWSPLLEEFEAKCLLTKGCLGSNCKSHYVRTACWHHSSFWGRHRLSLSVVEILAMKPDRVRAKALAKLCYLLVKTLNFSRQMLPDVRPENVVLHVFRYR